MRRFHGRGGELHVVSGPARLDAALTDCGDGFHWRAAEDAFAYWLGSEPLSFGVRSPQGWVALTALCVRPTCGWVEFDRCVSGLDVRVSGTCLPTALVGRSESWRLSLRSMVADDNTLAASDDARRSQVIVLGGDVVLDGFDGEVCVGDTLLARLRLGAAQMHGLGDVTATLARQVIVRFDEGSVTYGP